MLVVWVLLAFGNWLGYLASAVGMAVTGRRISNAMRAPETQPRDVAMVAVQGLWSAAMQLAAAICRHYWPVALVAARSRGAAAGWCWWLRSSTACVDWLSRRRTVDDDTKPIGLVPYLVLKRLDDLAYGVGLWTGVMRERNIGPLKPQIRT